MNALFGSSLSVFLKLDVLGGGCGCPQPRLARWILELLILDPFSDRRVIVCTMRNFFQGWSFNACPGNLIEPLALLLSSSSRVTVYDHCTQWSIILGDRNFFVRYALTSFTDRKAGLFLGYSGSGRLWAGCSGVQRAMAASHSGWRWRSHRAGHRPRRCLLQRSLGFIFPPVIHLGEPLRGGSFLSRW